MPRHRLPETERKDHVNLRLPKWMINQILKNGSFQEIIERILRKHIKRDDNSENLDIDKT